ncbi:putative bifunctional diguanylate cyclase/phosphodiesterase [Roseibium sp.]|uniref:putative bifunctional diguanylate cyclase/phosphodiesterase n=1 Tax=Roseibium sp. TaxID=1936156 RepID=UPI003A97A6E1
MSFFSSINSSAIKGGFGLAVTIAPTGYLLATLGPHSFIMAHKSPWVLGLFDLAIGYFIATAIIGFLYGMTRLLRLKRQIMSHSVAEQEARQQADHDALTGLANRRKFHEDFGRLTANVPFESFRAVMMLDVDGFKPINDVYGHAFGDTLLREFAHRLSDVVGRDGFVARLGGDEFAIVSPELDEKASAASLARRVLASIQNPFILDNRQVQVGTGIGIAMFPNDGYSATELLRRADIALYRAKTSGRSVYRFFEMEMDAAILHRTLLEQRLRSALAAREIEVHFQPILDLNNSRIRGFEALARWSDRDFGHVPPEQFISIAEDCGLISELTDQLLREACDVAKTWPSSTFLSFNVSPLQLHDHTFPLKVVRILSDSGLTPERLVLEITETSLFKNPRAAKAILEQLSEAKIRIALDDFGTGQSSLGYLRDFPISKVKIDKSFTMQMQESEESAAIIDAILVLAKGLGIETVAEGIEQAEVLERLTRSGCEYGQGFYFGPAKSAKKLNDHFGLSEIDIHPGPNSLHDIAPALAVSGD